MQINKLHVQPHAVSGPKSQKLTSSRGNDSNIGAADTHSRDLTSGNDAVRSYADQLKSVPEVRADSVEAARTRLANGEYTTSQAAVETATAILNRS